jgi:hypothetical protein
MVASGRGSTLMSCRRWAVIDAPEYPGKPRRRGIGETPMSGARPRPGTGEGRLQLLVDKFSGCAIDLLDPLGACDLLELGRSALQGLHGSKFPRPALLQALHRGGSGSREMAQAPEFAPERISQNAAALQLREAGLGRARATSSLLHATRYILQWGRDWRWSERCRIQPMRI